VLVVSELGWGRFGRLYETWSWFIVSANQRKFPLNPNNSELLRLLRKLPLIVEDDPKRKIEKQEENRDRLLKRASSVFEDEKFLALYDASMRSLEIILLFHSLKFGDTPHRILKDVVKFLNPNFRIDELVAKRHQIKKNQKTVDQKDLDQVRALEFLLANTLLKIRSELRD